MLIEFECNLDNQSEYYLVIHDFLSLSGIHDICIADKMVRPQSSDLNSEQDPNIYVKIPDIYVKEGVIPVVFSDSGRCAFSEITVEKINLKSLSDDHQKLLANTLQNMKFDGKRLTGDIYVDSPGLLFMSIPYSPKWECYIDREKTRIYKADTGFSAVEIGAGEHDVKFEYYYFR